MHPDNEDFALFVSSLEKNGLISPGIDPQMKNNLKEVHRRIYSFLIWDQNLKHLPDRASLFLKEMRSDAISSIILVLSGHNKASAHYLRNIIENVVRLIYFADHPIEYIQLYDSEFRKDEMSFKCYFQYLVNHPIVGQHTKALNVVDKLINAYSETSRYVHA